MKPATMVLAFRLALTNARLGANANAGAMAGANAATMTRILVKNGVA